MISLWKKIIMGAIGGLLALGGFTGYKIVKEKAANVTPNTFTVVSVIDGDTIKIKDNQRVRLLGIDAPEKGACFYEESRDYLKNLIEGRLVRLQKDISGQDRYERLLRYVILPAGNKQEDDLLINDQLVREGYARSVASPPDNRYRDLLASAQRQAKQQQKGLWSACPNDEDVQRVRQQNTAPDNPNCVIKGNISEKGYGKTYLIPGCDNYNRVKIDTQKGEQYFCTEAEAQDAGFRKATNCP